MGDGLPLFLLSEKGESTVSGMPVAVLELEVARMRARWPGMPVVMVVRSVDDLPFKAPVNADGAYSTGKVYVVAENITNLKQFQKVMAHECVMHHSLEEMLGNYGFAKLNHGIHKLIAAGDPVVCALADNIARRYGPLSKEDETREIVARAGEQCLDEQGNVRVEFGWMKGVFAGVASWLRDHGIMVRFSDTELQGIIHGASRWIERGEKGVNEKTLVAENSEHALCSFAGELAKDAPLEQLSIARDMQKNGIEDREIWQETGWTFGFADGKPRFEVNDQAARLMGAPITQTWEDFSRKKLPAFKTAKEFAEHKKVRTALRDEFDTLNEKCRPMSDLLAHEALYVQYPHLKNIDAENAPYLYEQSMKGAFNPVQQVICFDPKLTADTLKSTLHHELQHAIQEHENFARGGWVTEFKDLDITDKALQQINQQVHALYSQNSEFYADSVKATQLMLAVKDKFGSTNGEVDDPLMQAWWAAIDKRDEHVESVEWFGLKAEEGRLLKNPVVLTAVEQYRRLAGEVEARLTQSRASMNEIERRATYPVDGMDVKVADQVLKFSDSHSKPSVER